MRLLPPLRSRDGPFRSRDLEEAVRRTTPPVEVSARSKKLTSFGFSKITSYYSTTYKSETRMPSDFSSAAKRRSALESGRTRSPVAVAHEAQRRLRRQLIDGEREASMAFENPLDPAMECLNLFEG
jgi:hypothetical protein